MVIPKLVIKHSGFMGALATFDDKSKKLATEAQSGSILLNLDTGWNFLRILCLDIVLPPGKEHMGSVVHGGDTKLERGQVSSKS